MLEVLKVCMESMREGYCVVEFIGRKNEEIVLMGYMMESG